eukprot:4970850-Alexandrium_andersonii.AAC.1
MLGLPLGQGAAAYDGDEQLLDLLSRARVGGQQGLALREHLGEVHAALRDDIREQGRQADVDAVGDVVVAHVGARAEGVPNLARQHGQRKAPEVHGHHGLVLQLLALRVCRPRQQSAKEPQLCCARVLVPRGRDRPDVALAL